MQINKPKKQRKTKLLVVVISAVIVLLAGGLTYAYVQKVWPFTASDTASTPDDSSVNYDPPTEQEVKDSQDGKKNVDSTDEPTNSTPPDKKKTAAVGISYADVYGDNLEIRAFTNSVIEGTGSCTATVTMGNSSSTPITKTSKAFIDTSSTQCEPIYIPTSDLRSGTWNVSVKFSSPDYEGTSEVVKVKIP